MTLTEVSSELACTIGTVIGYSGPPQVAKAVQELAEMKVKYEETARGGLAVNVIAC